MDLKKQLTALGILTIATGALALPALADFGVSFNRYDYDRDGRWNYREFVDANRAYYIHHPGAVVMEEPVLRRDFRRIDRDNDGYVRVDEVRRYHEW